MHTGGQSIRNSGVLKSLFSFEGPSQDGQDWILLPISSFNPGALPFVVFSPLETRESRIHEVLNVDLSKS